MRFSLIIPFHNEQDIIDRLAAEVQSALNHIQDITEYEILCINDGSSDATLEKLKQLPRSVFRIISSEVNKGQSAAIAAGISFSRFEVLGVIDADLQTDPNDFSLLIAKMKEGFHCVNGKRLNRNDNRLRILSSCFARQFRQSILQDTFFDITCPLKVFEKNCIDKITFYDTFHRFIPYLIQMQGYRVCEIEVRHYPRTTGKSHYGVWNRALVGLKSLRAIKWMRDNYIFYTPEEL